MLQLSLGFGTGPKEEETNKEILHMLESVF